jgi:SH3-like domain-containing protein
MECILMVATYRPKAGQAAALSARLREHQAALWNRGHVQAEQATCVWLDDGTAVEITDWKDDDSRVRAAVDPEVMSARAAVDAAAEAVCRVDLR